MYITRSRKEIQYLEEMVILGINTNLDFQYQLMNNREFCEGKADTGFIERLLKLD